MCVSQLLVTKQASIALDYFLSIGVLYFFIHNNIIVYNYITTVHQTAPTLLPYIAYCE